VPKINVYLPQWLADAVSDAELPVSEVCQRALAEATGRNRPMTAPSQPKVEWWRHQTYADRAADLERAAMAIRYGLAPTKTVPAMIKPLGAATALSVLRAEDPSFLQWETKAQDVAQYAAAVEVATELGANKAVIELLQRKLDAAREELDAVVVSGRFGEKQAVLDLMAELQERAHPRPVK
jgi:ATP-dependent Clp protease ATP-binding subunit ClpC